MFSTAAFKSLASDAVTSATAAAVAELLRLLPSLVPAAVGEVDEDPTEAAAVDGVEMLAEIRLTISDEGAIGRKGSPVRTE